MALDTQVPQWLVSQEAWQREDASRSTQELIQNMFKARELNMEQQKLQLQQKQGLLGMQQQQQDIQLNHVKLDSIAHDQDVIPKWLQDHPTWEDRQNAQDWPTAFTPEGESQLAQIRLRDAQSVQQKAATVAVTDFSKRVGALSKTYPSLAGQFTPYIGKANVPMPVLKALNDAEISAQTKTQMEQKQAESDARARGDVQSTTTGPKGITNKFTPAKPDASKSQFKPEEPVSLKDGGQLIHVSPNRWQYVKGNSKTDLTPEQKRNVAHELLGLNPKDPRGLKILDELAGMALSKKNNSTASPTAPTASNDPLNLFGK